jgi:hypothetical protein
MHLALVAQIVRQLAITIDLAAVSPGLTDQFGMAQHLPARGGLTVP